MLSPQLQQLVEKNKALFRDCKIDTLNEEAIVERFLNYAEIDDIKTMIKLIGYDRVRDIFKQQIMKERCNYISPAIINLFILYFQLQDELGSSLRSILERTERTAFFYRTV